MKIYFLFFLISFGAGQESCTSRETSRGECRGPGECPPLYHLVATISTGDLLAHVGNCRVDWEGNKRICCPLNNEGKCVASPGEGTCRRLTECPDVERLFRDIPFNQFKRLYGGCLDDDEGNERWCCPTPPEKCTTSRSSLRGECQLLSSCKVLNDLSHVLSGSFVISTFGAGCNNERIQDTMICCPFTEPFTIATEAVPDCKSPSHVIPDLGCIVPVVEHKTWDDARMNCNALGGRLLEGFRKEHYLPLHEHFYDYLPITQHYVLWSGFVGIRNFTWFTTGVLVDDDVRGDGIHYSSNTVWDSCGEITLPYPPVDSPGYLTNQECFLLRPSLCQLLH